MVGSSLKTSNVVEPWLVWAVERVQGRAKKRENEKGRRRGRGGDGGKDGARTMMLFEAVNRE
jgi:hypothetical protein